MILKAHLIQALEEEFQAWQAFLQRLTPAQRTAPILDLNWSVKDVINHLWAWQQVSIARIKAAVQDTEPVFPEWVAQLPENWEEEPEKANAMIYARDHSLPWETVFHRWESGFQQLLELTSQVEERDLLEHARYSWLNGYPLIFILLASYAHHQEHLEALTAWHTALSSSREIVL